MAKYITQRTSLSKRISEQLSYLKRDGEEHKLSRFIAILCIEGFKESMIRELLSQFHEAGYIKLHNEENKLFIY